MVKEIKKLTLFKNIESSIIEDLVASRKIIRHSYSKGMTVYEEGSTCLGIDIVSSGKLVAYSLTARGSETVVSEFYKDSIIGANLLFGVRNTYPMNIYSAAKSTSFHLTKDAIYQLLKEYSFVLAFINSLSQNSQRMNQKIVYTHKSLRDNLMDYFYSLSVEENSNLFTLPITKKQLADKLGVQRPSLFRELKKMKDEGLIEVNNRNIRLVNYPPPKA